MLVVKKLEKIAVEREFEMTTALSTRIQKWELQFNSREISSHDDYKISF